jgi:hypothetical protein
MCLQSQSVAAIAFNDVLMALADSNDERAGVPSPYAEARRKQQKAYAKWSSKCFRSFLLLTTIMYFELASMLNGSTEHATCWPLTNMLLLWCRKHL